MRNVHPTKPTSLFFVVCFLLFVALTSCSIENKIARSAKTDVLNTKALQAAHIGISIFDPGTNKYLYNYQGDKYFVPASNTKIPTCYAAMKYLGDSLVGLRYGIPEDEGWRNKVVVIDATGDPTFLHDEFVEHNAFEFLQKTFNVQKKSFGFLVKKSNVERWGNGWSWNDYESGYMAERSPMPIFGNVLNIKLLDSSMRRIRLEYPGVFKYRLFTTGISMFDSLTNNPMPPINSYQAKEMRPKVIVERDIARNWFSIQPANVEFKNQIIPFVTAGWSTAIKILMDTLRSELAIVEKVDSSTKYAWLADDSDIGYFHIKHWTSLYSQPTDSLLKPMMHRSDNFFAEQTLLMVSNEKLGVMNDAKIIDTILKTDFKDLPQMPRWADGSGLSRYNLFTPQSLIAILNKMKNEFGMDRIKVIFPTGGEGTISNYYKSDSGFIYGKTGTLSGVVAFSGFMYTKKGKLLIFSTLVNNHRADATDIRKAMEKFLQGVRNTN